MARAQGIAAVESASHCSSDSVHDLHLAWTAKLGASIYSSPLIMPADRGGTEIWASTFVRYAEVIDGMHGSEVPGWPSVSAHSTVHTGPLSFDVDADGVDEMLFLNFDAEAVFLSSRGLPLRGRGFRLPKLRVRKDWFAGLHDVHTMPFKRDAHRHHDGRAEGRLDAHLDEDTQVVDAGPGSVPSPEAAGPRVGGESAPGLTFEGDIGAHGGLSADAEASFGLFAVAAEGDDNGGTPVKSGSGESVEPRRLAWAAMYEDPDVLRDLDARGYARAAVRATPLRIEPKLLRPGTSSSTRTLSRLRRSRTSTAMAHQNSWLLSRTFSMTIHPHASHGTACLSIRTIMWYAARAHPSPSGMSTCLSHLVFRRQAGGVLAVDPLSGSVKWSVHLDLTTERTKLRAYIYSAVTVADLDGDGAVEVAVGTSMGFLYVLAGADGELRDGTFARSHPMLTPTHTRT